MRGNGLFSTFDAPFADFLSDTGSGSDPDTAYPARNFLLDEGVLPERGESYRDARAVAGHPDVEAWRRGHKRYLQERIWAKRAAGASPSVVDPGDPLDCPETFRFIDPAWDFRHSDLALDLVRMEQVETIARLGDSTAARVGELASAVIASGWKRDASYVDLDDVLARCAEQMDARPAFVGFWEDVCAAFGDAPDWDRTDWAERLRDRLGLAHYGPDASGKPMDVLAFRCAVADVPRFQGQREWRPLVVPTVLDGDLSPAFCPAPLGENTGHTVDLAAQDTLDLQLCPELLHPHMRFEARHVWRVGRIERPVPKDTLPKARRWHLMCVQDRTGRKDYAAKTDRDLLA
ncbi:MAG: hypothetical protein FJX75_18170 [Armatimonadetes bacterium]|nr:hypothetical protein [Armatimonadota bacterium]